MKDDEARYLVDQYNKLISWRPAESQIAIVSLSVVVALFALALALMDSF